MLPISLLVLLFYLYSHAKHVLTLYVAIFQTSVDDGNMENMGVHGILSPLKAFGYAFAL